MSEDTIENGHTDNSAKHSKTNASSKRREPRRRSSAYSSTPLEENIRYLNGRALDRPLYPPSNVFRKGLCIALIAAIIGAIFLAIYFDNIFNGPVREREVLQANIDKEVTLDLPVMKELLNLDDAQIFAKLQETGATLFERVPVGDAKPFEVVKLPQDVTLAEAGMLYMQGQNAISASDAAKLLNGSWDLTVNRENGINLVIHYADFKSGTTEQAIGIAAQSQGFDTTNNIDSGTDDSGNTYMSGSFDENGTSYTWRISALPLSEIYTQNGLPEDAVYVGIRVFS